MFIKLADVFSLRYSPDGYRFFHNSKDVTVNPKSPEFRLARKVLNTKKDYDPSFRKKTTKDTSFFIHDGKVWKANRIFKGKDVRKFVPNRGGLYLRGGAIAKPIMSVKRGIAAAGVISGTAIAAAITSMYKNKVDKSK